jgi:Fe-S cluster biogenesis protein NfuA
VLILTERTPNPDARKFLPHVRLTDGAARAFDKAGFDPPNSPLAARLFALGSIRHVLIAEDFVTVTREASGESWDTLRIRVVAEIADHLADGLPAVATGEAGPPAEEGQVEAEIRQVLGLYVRPGVARDGGDVVFDHFDAASGVLWIRMKGACGGCPSARLTLKSGIENIVRRYVPEVARVEEVVESAAADGPPASRLKRWAEQLRGAAGGGRRNEPVFTHAGQPSPDKAKRAPDG